jgi:cysteine desulfurase/selenocysteine lyase
MTRERIYLDNAATSWPKPEAVYAAVDDYQRRLGAPAGRGAYATGQEVASLVAAARRQVASLIGAEHAKQICFGLNGTDVLNIAIHGLLREGDHVVTSVCEHNSVLRPLRWLAEHRGVSVSYLPCDGKGIIDADALPAAMQAQTRLIALTHASNVTGALQPIAEFARIARQREIPLLIDAAQSLGHVPINVAELGIDMLAAPGHKGLLGPLGTGVLFVADHLHAQIESLRQGGTGTSSEDDHQPSELPHKFEAGNLNVPGIVGLGAGAAWVAERTIAKIREHELQLTAALWKDLSEIEGVTLYGPASGEFRVGVVSFNVAGFDPQEVASMLDAAAGIEVRAGLHCAPRMHDALGTTQLGGTVRMSVGPFNTSEQIATAVATVAQLASSASEMLEP